MMRITKILLCVVVVPIMFAAVIWAADTSNGTAHIDDGTIHTPDYYDATVRKAFKRGDWEGGKRLLDEGLANYPDISPLQELAGTYYYHKKLYDDARYHLVKSLRDNNANVDAKQLLVKVEETTRNYSSAICYVNELLEVNPYWKGLWRKKIELYRKQGNNDEADRLLKRICKIYPNDQQLQKDLSYCTEQKYINEKRKGNKAAAIESLRELVDQNPYNEEHYLTLSNMLLQQGNRSEAIDIADRGVSYLPQSTALIMKKAGILAEEDRYSEALSFVELCMKRNHSARLSSFYSSLQEDAARAATRHDPYVLYGKIYERSKSQESLDYLLSTSMSRGYYEDALYYIGQARKRKGDTPDLLYKAYVVNKRMGNVRTANNLLARLYERNPKNSEITDELSRLRLEQASKLMAEDAYEEALPLLKFVTEHALDKEVKESAYSRIVNCNTELRRYEAAETALETLHRLYPNRSGYVEKHADLLRRRGRTEQALAFLEKYATSATDQFDRYMYVSAYEEMALPYIKSLMNNGATTRAYVYCKKLLHLLPSSEDGLKYATNAAAQLQHWDDFESYVKQGRQIYPDDRFYIVKQATIYNREQHYAEAIDLLRPQLDEFIGDTLLVNAFSTNSADWSALLIKNHQADSALAVVDSALVFDRDNRNLLYAKGLAYEALHQYDSAYVYQKFYRPDFTELPAHTRHLNYLLSKGYKNGLNFEYLQGRFGEEDVLTAVATVEYTRKLNEKNDIAARINYAGREGAVTGEDVKEQVSGGTGIQLQGEWTHTFNDKWSGTANAAWANKYFPQLMASVKAKRTFKNEWEGEVGLGIRRINSYKKLFVWNSNLFNEETQSYGTWTFSDWERKAQNLFNVNVAASKTINDFWLNAKLDGYALSSKFYVNLSAQAKYYLLPDGKTCIQALASVGSAPEATMIDFAMPGTFNHLNTMVGFGGQHRVQRHITLGLLGTWYTYYTQTNNRKGTAYNPIDYSTTRYKNLFNVDAQVLINF